MDAELCIKSVSMDMSKVFSIGLVMTISAVVLHERARGKFINPIYLGVIGHSVALKISGSSNCPDRKSVV